MFNDLRYAFRQLIRNPGFTAVVVFTLALSIGANTTLFSVVNAILLRPLPYQNPDKLVALFMRFTGIGIPKGDQVKIFEDFRQVDQTPRRAYGGTGLGLSICRRLTTMLRGTLKVESKLGHGSAFTLTLPAILRK